MRSYSSKYRMNSIRDPFFWISGSQKRSCFRMASLGLCTIQCVLCLQTYTQSIYVKEAKFSHSYSFSLPFSLFLAVSPLVCFEPDLRMGICMWRNVIFNPVHFLCCALIISNILQFPASNPAESSSRSSVSLK